jgi:hypothetical protein
VIWLVLMSWQAGAYALGDPGERSVRTTTINWLFVRECLLHHYFFFIPPPIIAVYVNRRQVQLVRDINGLRRTIPASTSRGSTPHPTATSHAQVKHPGATSASAYVVRVEMS